jgi:hypothetical protein
MAASHLQEYSVESLAVKRRIYVWCLACVIQWGCYGSYVEIVCYETASGEDTSLCNSEGKM